MFSIKVFVEGNIDEKSSVLQDTNPRFDNIDFNLNIDSGSGRIDLFKIPDTFGENAEHIMNILPGNTGELNLDPLNRKERDASEKEKKI